MRVEITQQDETHARYFVYDDADRELYQVHRDVTAEMQRARRAKHSLAEELHRTEVRTPSWRPRGER
jgi:hypothetical protein